MPDSHDTVGSVGDGPTQRIRQIVNDCIQRRSQGEAISDQSILEAHPDLAPALEGELHNVRLVEEAQRKAKQFNVATQHALHIRCPHCHNPFQVVDDTSLSDVVCASCGSHFSLVGEPRSFHAANLENVGHFKLMDKLGVGAFGTVWSARDTQLDRIVAIKFPRKGQISLEDTEQFIREARAAAQLDHPNIVRVLEVGREEDRVYIVSDFVRGLDLADWLTDQQATPREAAELCATVADALHHAHEHGVIHRDLKPSNIMLDTDGEPHLLDFGLAKREAGEITMTVDGKLLGTPAYMSPEQARGEAHEADRRSDVYSLGVILYELLTGERPFRGSTRMLLQQVLMEEAPSPRKLNQRIPRDLETICLRCLEKDPNQRYQTARNLCEDLQRFLSGTPVHARPITKIERLWRLCRRKPIVTGLSVAVASLLLFLAVAGPIVSVVQTRLRDDAERLAQAESKARQRAEDAEEAAKQESSRYRKMLYVSDMDRVRQAWEQNDVDLAGRLLARHLPQRGQEDLRRFEWNYLWHLCKPALTPPFQHGSSVCEVMFTDNAETVTALSSTTVKHWRVATRELLDSTPIDLEAVSHNSGRLSPSGKTAALADGGGRVTLVDLQTGERHILKGHSAGVFSVAFSPDGDVLASADWDGSVRCWSLQTLQPLFEIPNAHEGQIWCVGFSPDGKLVATGSKDETAKLWDVTNGEMKCQFDLGGMYEDPSEVSSVAFSPDGKSVATGSRGHIDVWDIETRQPVHSLATESWVPVVLFSPDGKTLASAWNEIFLWDTASGRLKTAIKGHGPQIVSLAFSPDGRTLASGTRGGTVKLEDLTTVGVRDVLRGHTDEVWAAAFSPDGRLLATGSRNSEVLLWDVSNTREIFSLKGHQGAVASLVFCQDGEFLATASFDKTAKLWDVSSGQLIDTFDHEELVYSIATAPHRDGLLATGSEQPDGEGGGGTVTLWDIPTRQRLGVLRGHRRLVSSLAISADGRTLATVASSGMTGTGDTAINLWDIGSQRRKGSLEGHRRGAFLVDFSPDGRFLASVSLAGSTIRLWDAERLRQVGSVVSDAHDVRSFTFTPDGKSLITANGGGKLTIYDVTDDGLSFRWSHPGHGKSQKCVAISNDGSVLATGHADATVRLWRAASPGDVQAAGVLAKTIGKGQTWLPQKASHDPKQ